MNDDRRPDYASQARAYLAALEASPEEAKSCGKQLDLWLTPRLTTWLEDLVERGDFTSTAHAVITFLQDAMELEKHPDLRSELFRRMINGIDEDK